MHVVDRGGKADDGPLVDRYDDVMPRITQELRGGSRINRVVEDVLLNGVENADVVRLSSLVFNGYTSTWWENAGPAGTHSKCRSGWSGRDAHLTRRGAFESGPAHDEWPG